jgi:oxygen-independent coproporphyrinogen-3 oxidase
MRSIERNLNLYAYLAVKLIDDDLYPHIQNLGRPIPLHEVRKNWEISFKEYRAGKGVKRIGMYLHIPFCTHKCRYCFCDSFVPPGRKMVPLYLAILKKELAYFSDAFSGVELTSLYFGGGTPSILKESELDDLFRSIYAQYALASDAQIIFEATPATLTKEKISLLVRHGVNRLTIGAQTLDEKVMRDVERQGSNRNFKRAFTCAKEAGIPFVNVDLMVGLEGQTLDSFINDMKVVVGLGADMVHINAFKPLSHTPFSREGRKSSADARRCRDIMIHMGKEYLAQHLYADTLHDEMAKSAYARNLQEADLRRQNSSLLGIGYGAQSHVFGHLWYQHPKSINCQPLDLTKIPPCVGIRSNGKREMVKYVVNNLRSGFSKSSFRKIFGVDVEDVFKKELKELEALGKATLTNNEVKTSLQNYKEYITLAKHLYPKDMIREIMEEKGEKFRPHKDYRRELEIYFPETD